MRYSKQIGWILIIFLFLGIGCEKKDMSEDLWGTEWKLDGFVRANGSWEPDVAPEKIQFKFLDSAEVHIQLPVNECGADVMILTESQIQLGAAVCTEICCDSQYSKDFMAILSQVASYYIKDKQLYLQGAQGSAIFIK